MAASVFLFGCSGGGNSSGTLKGTLVDGFGGLITHNSAVITLDGTSVIAHPAADGTFSISAGAGSYTLRGNYMNIGAGISLTGSRSVIVEQGKSNDIGNLSLSNSNLDNGWNAYRQGNFNQAETYFSSYLDQVRSGQANVGSSSAYSALGWTWGHGLDDPSQAIVYFSDATAGWPGNTDALAGLAASHIGLMKSDGGFHFNQASSAINSAIVAQGDYSSSPTHDSISETDLKVFRAFINLINGNPSGARTEALELESIVSLEGNNASPAMINVIIDFTN